MAHYTALHQIDQESGKTEPDISGRPDLSQSFSRFKWFAGGFCAAIATALVFTILYNAFDARRNQPGLIPDCKRFVEKISTSNIIQSQALTLNFDRTRSFQTWPIQIQHDGGKICVCGPWIGLNLYIRISVWRPVVHHGHIFVEDAARFSLKPGIPVSAHGERLIVSGLHGLHCLVS
jgi:hypothetical protein